MQTTTLNKEALLSGEELVFNNEHEPWEEAHELSVSFEQISTWDRPFKLWFDGRLISTFKSFSFVEREAHDIVTNFNLEARS